MNNQISIMDLNNQSLSVNLICYFKSNNKNYIFYDKGETVQNGLIKMYVAEENGGLTSDISQEEWASLKKVMQDIIVGDTNNINFMSYSNPIKFNVPKAIALNDANINAIKSAYKNIVSVSEPVLNKDILSQSFSANNELSNSVAEPVQISSIPNVQNNLNIEATPVNLNTTPIPDLSIPNMNPISNIETVVPNVNSTPVELNNEISSNVDNEIALNINNVKPSGIDTGFKVSEQPNIFDNLMAFPVTEDEINKTELPDLNNNNNNNNNPIIDNKENTSINNTNSNFANIDINNKKIELNNKKIKLFEELANIYKEENELLKNDSEETNSTLEHTASNLFNNNGTLIDSEVLY